MGALIYPLSFTDKTNSNNTYAVKTLYGSGGKLGVIPTMIPQGKDCYEYFIDEMGKTEEKLLHDINEMLDLSNMHHNFGVDINISD